MFDRVYDTTIVKNHRMGRFAIRMMQSRYIMDFDKKTLKNLEHVFTRTIHKIYECDYETYLVMPVIEGCNLKTLQKEVKTLSLKDVQFFGA